jgi:hypothetical protein
MSAFLPGQELSRVFCEEAVRPILDRHLPTLRHSAALLGYGSDVLGYDTVRSTDHGWGPRLVLFLDDDDVASTAVDVDRLLQRYLPPVFRGHAVDFGIGVPHDRPRDDLLPGGIDHNIVITTVPDFLDQHVGFRTWDQIEPVDWLLASEQMLLEVTAGAVYHDGLGQLIPMRTALAYYPRDIWLYLLSSQWRRISQQEAFVGRTGEVSDELGSAMITADLVRDIMRLAFLLERTHAPYAKWFGTAFSRLQSAPGLTPLLQSALAATSWQARQAALSPAYELMAVMQNRLGITDPLAAKVSPYYTRPFDVIHGEHFADAIEAEIEDPRIRSLPKPIGSIDQFVNSTDILTHADRRRRIAKVYQAGD